MSVEADANAAALPSWSAVPLHVLQAEIQRRQADGEKPVCGTKGNQGAYNTSAHVFALILILALSTLACAFPILARRFPKLPIPHHFLFLSRHFGTGVLIATAFVHLLPTAFTSLTDPCLPDFWNKGYPAMAGLVAMVSVLVIVGIEMFFATRGAGHIHGGDFTELPDDDEEAPLASGHARTRSGSVPKRFRQEPFRDGDDAYGAAQDNAEMQALKPGWEAVPTHSPGLMDDERERDPETAALRRGSDDESDLDLEELDPTTAMTGGRRKSSSTPQQSHLAGLHPMPADPAAARALEERLLLQCILLEAGILFHSVFIGMAVSVSVGPPFVVLLVAISFHQTFEGLALGSRIAAIPTFAPTSLKPWLMALAYGTTTPIGQAIGLAVHNLYDPHGQTGLLMVGTMNAISSGLLLFAGLVELLAEDFLSDASYQTLRGRRRKEACGAVVAGATLMALVGAWA